jgi:hypothetical protein
MIIFYRVRKRLETISLRLGGVTFTIKPRCWCVWYFLDEAGLAALQVGCVVIEWPTRVKGR